MRLWEDEIDTEATEMFERKSERRTGLEKVADVGLMCPKVLLPTPKSDVTPDGGEGWQWAFTRKH
jgi:hypothetical protein